jgi:hypothetical protein
MSREGLTAKHLADTVKMLDRTDIIPTTIGICRNQSKYRYSNAKIAYRDAVGLTVLDALESVLKY